MWYTDIDENSLYEVYIGSDNGIVTFPVNSRLTFSSLTNLTSIDFSAYIDTSNVENMDGIFQSCSSLTSLNLSNFDTSSVQNMDRLFQKCYVLEALDLSNFDTSNVTTMNSMFWDCDSLVSIDLSNFNTRKVTSMNSMFYRCDNLEYVKFGNYGTPLLNKVGTMFLYDNKLKKIDMSNFNFSSVSNWDRTFQNVPNSADIIVKDCTQYNLLTTGSGRTAGIRTITNMSTECTSS